MPLLAPAHIPAVDGLRAIAALAIVFYHLYTRSGNPQFRPFFHVNLLRPTNDGWAGVNLFLVLSGFCLFWPFARQPARPVRYGDFMLRRARRIVPAYYASLLLIPLGFWMMRQTIWPAAPACLPSGAWDVVLHLLLLHSLDPATIFTWHGLTWTLGLEWTWYLIFPLAVWMFRRFGPWRALIMLGGITIVYRCGLYIILGPSARLPARLFDLAATLRYFLAARLLEFILGMVVAWWLANKPIPRVIRLLAAPLTVVLLAAARLEETFDPFLPWRDATYGLAFAFMLLAIVSPHPNLLRRFCAWRPMRWIGECSYSLYLLHMLVVEFCIVLLQRAGFSGAKLFFVSLPAVVPAVFLARAGYLATEAPFLRSSKRKATRAAKSIGPVELGMAR